MNNSRGMALIQALVIVAAIAAVAAALMLRAETARLRLETRFQADQTALYLDSGVSLVRAMLNAIPEDSAVHRRQDWANPRSGIEIDGAVLAWTVDDAHGRFNVNSMNDETAEAQSARDAFLRLAQAQGISRSVARRMADALGPDPEARSAAVPGDPIPLPLADPRQLASIAGSETEAFAQFLGVVSALPVGAKLNINTAHEAVLDVLLADLPSAVRGGIARRVRRDPVTTVDEFLFWVGETYSPEIATRLEGMNLAAVSVRFLVTLEARLDSLRLRRSVVLNRGDAQGRGAVFLSMPETE